ncbi:MAG: SpoIVB peptidase S55 domain-containing protein [Thermoanaerobaculia bacterium]
MKFAEGWRGRERDAEKKLPVKGLTFGPLVGLAVFLFCSLTGLFAFQSPETFPEVATIPVEEIHAGMRGYGLSVFKGTVPERFEVEVLGVLENQKPGGSYILARLAGQNLEKSGVIAGMSGSPVYFDGRLAGAVAFSWPFATEPIAGITPIAQMRAIGSGAPLATAGAPARRSTASDLADIAAGRIPAARLDEELQSFARAVSNDGRSALLWGASGFGESSRSLLARLLPGSALQLSQLGGGERSTISSDLAPGTSVAALFVDGDLRLAATGTVTDRLGDRLLAFGHSAVGLSEISMPLATSEVITVMPSALSSFKLANSGPAVGRFERDHTYGSVGRVGEVARTVPLVVRVFGPVERRFDLRLAEMPQFLPALAALGCLGAWDVASGTGGVRSVDLALRIDLGGSPERAPLALEQSFEGPTAAADAAGFVISVLGYLAQNELAPLEVRAIEVDARLQAEPRAATLTFVRPSRTRLAPGEALDLQIDARGWRGESVRWSERIVVPSGLPDGKYSLLVGDGASADAARLALAPAPPTRIEQALEFLRSLHSTSDLVVLGVLPGAGLSAGGELLPRLPGSMRSIWGAMGSRSATVVRNAIVQNEAHRRDRPLAGLLRLDVEIRRPLDREPRVEGGGGGR